VKRIDPGTERAVMNRPANDAASPQGLTSARDSLAGVHLAQLNIARARGPMDSPQMAEFAARLDAVNQAADAAPGFVWRLVDADGANATGIRPIDNDQMLVNLSVWDGPQSLMDFVYRDSGHAAALRRRREWFEPSNAPMVVGWWIPEGHTPTVAEALERLEHLRRHGSTPYAFPLSLPLPLPTAPDADADAD
jgi:hypothetical protein